MSKPKKTTETKTVNEALQRPAHQQSNNSPVTAEFVHVDSSTYSDRYLRRTTLLDRYDIPESTYNDHCKGRLENHPTTIWLIGPQNSPRFLLSTVEQICFTHENPKYQKNSDDSQSKIWEEDEDDTQK